MGPRFKIKDKDLTLGYEHTPLQQSVQATIAVPGWLPSVTIKAASQWLGQDAEPSASAENTECFDVALRPDYDALTRALLEDADPGWFSGPQINPRWDPDPKKQGYVVQAGQGAQLLILGRNLWRNPKIFIGSQGTTSEYDYTVLPDMQGLVAKFSTVLPVPTLPGSSGETTKVDLRVVTSEGEAVLKDAVTILSGVPAGGMGAFVSLSNNWAVAGDNVTFVLNTNEAPRDFSDYELYLATNSNDPVPVATNSGPRGALLKFPMPAVTGVWASPSHALVNVKIRTSPQARPVTVLSGGEQPLVVFTNIVQSQFRPANPSLSVTTNGATLTLLPPDLGSDLGGADLFWLAWPGLAGSSAVVELASTNEQTAVLYKDTGGTPATIVQGKNGFAFWISPDATAKLGATGTNAVSCTAMLLTPPYPATRWRIPAGAVNLSLVK